MDCHSWGKLWGMGKLNTKKVRDATLPGRYGDGNGLYLHVREGGSRQWVVRVTVQGKRCDLGLGSLDTVTLEEAREAAIEMRRAAKKGIDPIAERRRQAGIPSYEEAARQLWQDHRATWKNEKHAAQWLSTQETYVLPFIGKLPLNAISSADVLKVLQPIWIAKEETARRVKQRMGTVFDWAIAAGYREATNPIEGIAKALPKQKRSVKHQAAMPWRDVPVFYEELRERQEETISAKALRLLILTALRSGEVRNARWVEFDLEKAVWTVPADRMKMKRPHRVPLSDEAIRLLKTCPEGASEFVFPGPKPDSPLSENAFAQLTKRMGRSGFTTHGFRSSFRDWSSETEAAPREVAEAALAHAAGDKTEQAYARSDLFERRRKMMQHWADFVCRTPAQTEPEPEDQDEANAVIT
jgi:integrase